MIRMPVKVVRFCYLISKWSAVSAFLAIVLLNCANLSARWISFSPFEWVLEVSLILFVYAVMLIVPVLYHDKAFIRMHLVEEVLSRRLSSYINLLADCLVLSFIVYLVYQGLSLSLGQFHTLSRGLGIPRFYVTIPLSLGAALSIPIGIDIFFSHLEILIKSSDQVPRPRNNSQ
jgi:TRAP-type C4-dicarboxylate transport system permease small subunit